MFLGSFPPITTLCLFSLCIFDAFFCMFCIIFWHSWHSPFKKNTPLNQPSPRNKNPWGTGSGTDHFWPTRASLVRCGRGVFFFAGGKGKIIIDYPSLGCLPRMLLGKALGKALSNFFLHLLHFLHPWTPGFFFPPTKSDLACRDSKKTPFVAKN